MATTPFGKYELHAKAGQGRLTVTYRARVAGTQRDVALKQLLPHVAADATFLQRYADEANAAAALPPHANLVQVLDHGHFGPTHFFTTEWVQGQTLHAVLDRARKKGLPFLPTPVALQIGLALCDGLAHLHGLKAADGRAQKLVHREVSVDSVLLGNDGQVKLMDFLLGPSRAATKSEMGVLKGKFASFSPEQARGEADLDRRSDVFAVGTVLYQLLCGRKPFEGELIDVLPKMLKGEYAVPAVVNRRLPPEVEVMLVRCLAPSRDGRYGSAAELAAELKGAMDLTFTPDRMIRFAEWLFETQRFPDPAFEAWLKTWLVDLSPATVRVPSLAELEVVRSKAPTMMVPADGPEAAPPAVRAEAVTAQLLKPVFTPTDPAAAVTDHVSRPAPLDTSSTAFALPPVGVPTDPAARSMPPLRRRVLPWAIAGAVLGFGALLVAVERLSSREAELVVTSSPAGATVFVDGREQAERTPVGVQNVAVDQPHTVIVDLPGHLRWKSKITVTRGVNSLHALLQPAPPAAAAPPPPPPPAATDTSSGDEPVQQ